MKAFVSLIIVLAFTISSCAENDKKEPSKAQNANEQTKTAAVQKVQIPVDGMTCSACQSNVRRTIKNMEGVKDVEVSLKDRNALVTYVPTLVKPEQIQQAINDKGYTAGDPKEVKQ